MARDYTPRRMPKRFRDGDCPDGVLDIIDEGPNSFADRYTVVYTEVIAPHDPFNRSIGYRGMCANPMHPLGVGMYGELKVHEMVAYRARKARKRIKWSDLPKDVRYVAKRDCRTDATA